MAVKPQRERELGGNSISHGELLDTRREAANDVQSGWIGVRTAVPRQATHSAQDDNAEYVKRGLPAVTISCR